MIQTNKMIDEVPSGLWTSKIKCPNNNWDTVSK